MSRGPLYRWTWPHAYHAASIVRPALVGNLVAYAVVLGAMALPSVRAATGVAFAPFAALIGVHAAWSLLVRYVLGPRARARGVFDALVLGNVVVGTTIASSFAWLGDSPGTILWGALVLYATMNGALVDLEPSIVLQLVHGSVPVVALVVFRDRPWGTAGPLLAAAFALTGYHLAALNVATARRERAVLEAARARAEREAADLRLARDLHDGIGAALGTVKFYADTLATEAHSVAGPLSEVAETGLLELRAMLDALSPPPAQGFMEAIEAIARRTAPPPIEVCHRGTLGVVPPGPARVALARIVQEAVSNAVRHGRPRRIELETSDERSDGLRLVIRDDGQGFDLPTTASGRGLAGMRARAVELGGLLDVRTSPGAGCELEVRIPRARLEHAP